MNIDVNTDVNVNISINVKVNVKLTTDNKCKSKKTPIVEEREKIWNFLNKYFIYIHLRLNR